MRLVGRNQDRLSDVTAISLINFRSLTVLAVSLIVMPSSVIPTSGHSVQCGHGLNNEVMKVSSPEAGAPCHK